MRIVVTGGTGFLGQPLCAQLADEGHEVRVLSRGATPAPTSCPWSGRPGVQAFHWPGDSSVRGWGHLIDGADAVVNLAGESIAARRWTARQKAAIERSRIGATRAVVEGIASATEPPALLVSGSAVGYYGSRGDEILTESSPPGDDFLAGVAVKWEHEAIQAASARTRVVRLRTGVVLAGDAPALRKMLLPFRLGVGGRLGSGQQYLSWIHRDDWLALVKSLVSSATDGAYNVVAPVPVTNAEFTRAVASALRRPALVAAPAFALRLAMGEMADQLVLTSHRVVPDRALREGFTFRYPTFEAALRQILTTPAG